MLFVNRGDLTRRNYVCEKFVKSSGLLGFRIVTHVRGEKTVLIGKLPIPTDREVIFGGYILRGE